MNATETSTPLTVTAAGGDRSDEILTTEALRFVAELDERFDRVRRDLLFRREQHQADLDGGIDPVFPEEPAAATEPSWKVPPAPGDLRDRRVEITGPVDRKMMINALNSGAQVFMADFEDANSPTWTNCVQGQVNLADAVRRTLELTTPEGKQYRLGDRLATLMVRPRGWHLEERHAVIGDRPVSASLFDFGLYFFHNARQLVERGSGPYFYLPKLESHLEARLWDDVFSFSEERLGLPMGTVRATVLIENVLAAFDMEAILYELRRHSAGLNAGRWDYIFSVIRKFRARDFVLPDRAQVTMGVPFMRAYTERLVSVCHRHGAHAIGGMAAFIPNRRDPEVTERALGEVRRDKEREAGDGFDGTWVAHPDLVPVAKEVFDRQLGDAPHQKDRLREDVEVSAEELLDFRVPGGRVTEAGVRANVGVALAYLDAWLGGWGAAAINDLMEDTATAEISRAQLWQWRVQSAKLDDGRTFDAALYRAIRDEELARLGGAGTRQLATAAELMDHLVLTDEFVEFLTLEAYERLES